MPPVAVAVTLVIVGDDPKLFCTPVLPVPPVAVAVTWSMENVAGAPSVDTAAE